MLLPLTLTHNFWFLDIAAVDKSKLIPSSIRWGMRLEISGRSGCPLALDRFGT